MKILKTTRVSKKETFTVNLDREAILALCPEIPRNATVYFEVPGGGDWSNCAIDISERDPIIILWTVEETAGALE